MPNPCTLVCYCFEDDIVDAILVLELALLCSRAPLPNPMNAIKTTKYAKKIACCINVVFDTTNHSVDCCKYLYSKQLQITIIECLMATSGVVSFIRMYSSQAWVGSPYISMRNAVVHFCTFDNLCLSRVSRFLNKPKIKCRH